MNILIVRLSAIGDVIHCLPLAAQIKARLPEAKITWLVEPPARALLENNEAVDQVIVFEKKDLVAKVKNPLSLGTGILNIQALIATLSVNQFDMAIDAQGLLKSALLAWGSKAPIRVGFKGAREGSSLLMTDTLDVGDYYGLRHHVVDHNIALADFAIEILAKRKRMVPLARPGTVKFPLPIPQAIVRQGVERLIAGPDLTRATGPASVFEQAPNPAAVPPPTSPSPMATNPAAVLPPASPSAPAPDPATDPAPDPATVPPQVSLRQAPPPEPLKEAPSPGQQEQLQALSISLNCPIAVLIPGTTWKTKIWPAERWMELGAKLLASGVGRIIICGGKADEGTNQSIYKGIGSLVGEPASTSIIDLTAKTDLIQLISLFEIADLVIGADSGPVHLAAAVARPLVVAVHGSTPWLRNGPYGQKGRAVYAAIPCQPCFSKTCSLKTIECLRDLPADKVIEAIAQAL